MSELNNPLLAGGFDGTVDLDALQGIMDPSFTDQDGDGIPDHYNQELAALHTNHRGYIGDDGKIYRKELTYNKQTGEFDREYTDERLYFWTPPQELGDRGLNGDQEAASAGRDKFGAAGLYTESEIREAFEADQGMGYLKKANPDLTWDKYWDFVQKTTDIFTDSEYDDMLDGNMSAGNFQDSPEYMALLEESGIALQYVNEDGDVFNWNGTGYSKDFKVDDSLDIGVINNMALGLIGGFVAGPLIAGALTPALGVAGAKAATAAITSMASQYMTEGEVDFTQALISAATAYGGAKMGDLVKGAGIFGEVGDKMSDVAGKFEEFLSTGNSIADAAIKAGGMSLLTQFVTTGEIDPMQAGIAALMAGGTQAFSEWTAAMYDAGEPVSDELLEEITVEAKRVGNDLGNGMYELDGVVFSEEGGYIGNMTELDLNGDGALTGDDLQNITTPDRELVDPTIRPDNNFGYEMGDDVYVDADGNPVDPSRVKFGPDGYVVDGQPVTTKPYNEVFGGDKGGLEWKFGLNEDGSVSDTDGAIYYENGELAYEKITTTETLLDADGNPYESEVTQWRDADGNIIDDPTKVDELTMIAAKAVDAPLESVQYYDQDGNPVNYKYAPYELRDSLENGQFSGLIFGPNGEVQEVWYDPTTGTEYIKSDEGFQGVQKVDPPDETPETPETPDTSDDSTATGDPNQDTDQSGQGSGGGDTDSTGGSATPGLPGGGGTEGGGTDAGGSDAGGTGGDVVLPPTFLPPLFPPVTGGTDGGTGGDGGDVVDSTNDGSGVSDGTGGGDSTGAGDGSGGSTGGSGTGDSDGDGTGGTGGGDSTGAGDGTGAGTGEGTGTGESGEGTGTDGSGEGTGDGTGEGGGAGDAGGTGGGTGGGSGDTTGGGTGDTTGPTFGPAPGPGGPGFGAGGGGQGGLLSGGGDGGGDYTPQWGELFDYEMPKGYERQQVVANYRDYIEEAKGYLS